MITTSCIENLARLFEIKLDKLDTEIAGVNLPLFEAADSETVVLTEFRPTVHDPIDVGDEAFGSMNSTNLSTMRHDCRTSAEWPHS